MDDTAILDTLTELASLGMRAARVVTGMMELEHRGAELTTSFLPEPGYKPPDAEQAEELGKAIDLHNDQLAAATSRTEALALSLDRLSRSVRRTLALHRRVAAGWTGTRSDSRAAMTRRHVARRVGEAIRRERAGEAAERLFDELALRLEHPSFDAECLAQPLEALVRKICHELGLGADPHATPPPGADGPGWADTG